MLIEKQFRYKQWSNQRLLNAVRQIDKQRFPEEYAFIKQQFNHIAIVEALFKARLLGQAAPHTATNTEILPSLHQLEQNIYELDLWSIQFSQNLQIEQLQQQLAFQFTDGKYGKLSIEEMLFHLINHATYHRGNIAHALHHAGITHPADTYTVFIHETEPQRRIH